MIGQNMQDIHREAKAIEARGRVETAERWKDFRDYPLFYGGLFMTGLLSSFCGIFLGLAPTYEEGILSFHDLTILNYFFAFLYAVCFPLGGEYATAEWHKKRLLRDVDEKGQDNKKQKAIATVMLVASIAFSLLTAISAATILATLMGFLDVFVRVPDVAQWWVVLAIPIAGTLHMVSSSIYKQCSFYAISMRLLNAQVQRANDDAHLQIQQARNEALVKEAKAQAAEYTRLAQQEAATLGQEKARQVWEQEKSRRGIIPAPALDVDSPTLAREEPKNSPSRP